MIKLPALTDRRFFLYDTVDDHLMGTVSFEIPYVDASSSDVVSSIYGALQVTSGQSVVINSEKLNRIATIMNLNDMTAGVCSSVKYNDDVYNTINSGGYSYIVEQLRGTTDFKDLVVTPHNNRYRLLVSENVIDDNYFVLAVGPVLSIGSFKYNGSAYNISEIGVGISVFPNNNTAHLGASCMTNDNKFVYCTLWDSSQSMNVIYNASTSSESVINAFINLYQSAGIVDTYNVSYDLEGCEGAATNPLTISANAAITRFSFTPTGEIGFTESSAWVDGKGANGSNVVQYVFDPDTGKLRVGQVTSDIIIHVFATTDPYSEIDGMSDLAGGSSIAMPSLPALSATDTGAIGLFAPTASQMKLLTDYMWTDFGGTGSTEVDVLKEVVQAIKRVIANPLEYIFGLNIIPSQGLSIGSSEEIRFGFVNSGISMPRLTSQYFTVDCGSISFDAVCGDTFLDYAPYSKFSIYLPYVGIKEVDANDFVGHTIGVQYHGDVVTGGITAYITKDGSVMYQYSGCCALTIPMSADSWGNTISGAVQISTALIASIASGGAAGVGEAAAMGASSVAANPSLLSPAVARSGAMSGGAGCMGVQIPFVIREAVRFHSTAGFNSISGYPAYYFASLGSVKGYTRVYDVHLHGIGATSPEIDEIESLLKSGVIL